MLDFSEDVTAEATAYAVKFLSHQRRDSALLPKAALWLMNHRNEGYWWSSTKQTAMVIYGLDRLPEGHGRAESQPHRHGVRQRPAGAHPQDRPGHRPGRPAAHARRSQARSPASTTSASPPPAQGRLYYSARAEYYSTEDKLQKTGTVSLNILRDYFRLVPGKDGDKIVYDVAPLAGSVASGDIIAVRLTVTGSEWKYLMLEDPIPAGTEFIERDNIYRVDATARPGGITTSRAANCTTTGWPFSRPGSRRASSSISIC